MATLSQQTRTEKLLLEAARLFNSTLDYEELIASVLRLVTTAVDAEAAMLFRIDHFRTDIKVRALIDNPEGMVVFHHDIGQDVGRWGKPFLEGGVVDDLTSDPRFVKGIAEEIGTEIRSMLSVPLIGKGHMIGVVQAFNHRHGVFSNADFDILTGLNNQIAVAIDNAHLYREVKREALEKDLLYTIGKKLAGKLDLKEVMDEILVSLRQVVSFNSGGVFLLDPEHGEVNSLYTVGYESRHQDRLKLKIGQGLVGHVAKSGKPVIVPDVKADPRYVEANELTQSEIVVPIWLDARQIGVLTLESHNKNAYDHRSLSLISAFATQAAIAIERARLHEDTLTRQRLESQLGVARQIQQTFLPRAKPVVANYDLAGSNRSSGEVGGDYYDFIPIVESQMGIAIGDVSGKGMPAALIMASFRASLIAEIRNNYAIRTICAKVNNLLLESIEPGNYVTAVYGVLDTRNHIFTYANCGHNLPILVRADGSVSHLEVGGAVLGVTPEAEFAEEALFLQPGDMVFLYTDGVTEVFSEDGTEFGMVRLEQLLIEHRSRSADRIRAEVESAVRTFAGADHMFDDLTMVVLKRSR